MVGRLAAECVTTDTCISHSMEQRRTVVTLPGKDYRVPLPSDAVVRWDYRPNPISKYASRHTNLEICRT